MTWHGDSDAISIARQTLLQCYQAALQRVRGRECVADALRTRRPAARVAVVAIGKAAASMAEGALRVWDDVIEQGLLITKYGHADADLCRDARWQCLEAGHPVPDQASLQAGQCLLEWLDQLDADIDLLFLISGGASSLVEVLRPGLELQDLQQLNQMMLAQGWPIDRINNARKQVSQIKGGGLRHWVSGHRCLNLMISDVTDDRADLIGSGLLVLDNEPAEPDLLPQALAKRLQIHEPAPRAVQDDMLIDNQLVATNHDAMRAAAVCAEQAGYPVTVDPVRMAGDVTDMAGRIVSTLVNADAGVYIWGGEVTVQLPAEPGQGGRAQHLALLLADRMQGSDDIVILSAGTDGSDGPGEDAGAIVDGGTVVRGEMHGESVQQAIAAANAGGFLDRSGDLLQTGPTGTNVNDLVIAIK